MNNQTYKKLSNLQADLDNYIAAEKSIYMPDYKLERIIALSVEFHELLNEVRFIFKYWSYKQMDRGKALGEYVDGIHFLLSIGNDLNITDYEYNRPVFHDMRRLALGISNMISLLPKTKDYHTLMDYYILFGEKLGFSMEEVEQAYLSKNNTNYERQATGY